MDKEQAVINLLSQNSPSITQFKKFLLCVHHGCLRINGESPDNAFTLSDYLLDHENIILDYAHLSLESKKVFENWMYLKSKDAAKTIYAHHTVTNDFRGYTAEAGLTFWGRLLNFLFYRKKTYAYPLMPFALSKSYQLRQICVSPGEYGVCVGLNQSHLFDSDNKYHENHDTQDKPMRNAKRVMLTDALVKQITSLDLNNQNFKKILTSPHPFAIQVEGLDQRYEIMREYRQTERLYSQSPWYIRLWRWLFFRQKKESDDIEMQVLSRNTQKWENLIEKEDAVVLGKKATGEILIREKRPDLDTMVFCGGGGKIFGHVGAYRAFETAGIKATKFAGSSAGGIMALLCYLGYSSKDIQAYFTRFRRDNLVHYDVSLQGMSDTKALKSGIDFMIIQKVNEIIQRFQIDKTISGMKFLTEQVFNTGKITFSSLQALKKQYPECGIGEELVITATHMKKQKTRYFSTNRTPDVEVSQSVAMSACMPVLFKPTEGYTDGGMLNNFPTEAFRDNETSFLKSKQGNCLHMVAFQFDNGTENEVMYKKIDKVYRESALYNWFLGHITGIKDPATGWVRDRLKLQKYSNQSILIPVGNVSASQFELDEKTQSQLIEQGYNAAQSYIEARYEIRENKAFNEEYLYEKFSGMEEALFYSCERGRLDWFDTLAKVAEAWGVSEQQIQVMRTRYFSEVKMNEEALFLENIESPFDSSNDFLNKIEIENIMVNMTVFEVLYPVLLQLPLEMFKNNNDKKAYRCIRHQFTSHNAIDWCHHLDGFQGERHIIFEVLRQVLMQMDDVNECVIHNIGLFSQFLADNLVFKQAVFFKHWNLSSNQLNQVLQLIENQDFNQLKELCFSWGEELNLLKNVKKIKKSVNFFNPGDNFVSLEGAIIEKEEKVMEKVYVN